MTASEGCLVSSTYARERRAGPKPEWNADKIFEKLLRFCSDPVKPGTGLFTSLLPLELFIQCRHSAFVRSFLVLGMESPQVLSWHDSRRKEKGNERGKEQITTEVFFFGEKKRGKKQRAS